MTNVAFVALACGIIVGLGAFGASIGIALMGGMRSLTSTDFEELKTAS